MRRILTVRVDVRDDLDLDELISVEHDLKAAVEGRGEVLAIDVGYGVDEEEEAA